MRLLARPRDPVSHTTHHIHTSLDTHVLLNLTQSLLLAPPSPCTPRNHNGPALITAGVAADCRDVDNSHLCVSTHPSSLSLTISPSLTASQFLLAAITFGPWIALLVYDIILYIWRSATFDLPQIGGRARGQRQRPRAPSLKERPDGHKRRFSLAAVLPPVDFHQVDGPAVTTPTTTSASGHKRNITATMSRPIFEFVDDDE